MSRVGYSLTKTPYPFTVGTAFQESYQTASKEKEQLQAELDVTKRTSQARNQNILKLEEELQAKQKGLDFLTDQFEQLKQQGKFRVSVANSQVKKCFITD